MQHNRRNWQTMAALCAAVALIAAPGCGGDTKTDTKSEADSTAADAGHVDTGGQTGKGIVTVSGKHAVAVGKTLKLSASTSAGGSDTSYTWTSADEAIATVDATGQVTGVAAGETFITATGVQTGVMGKHPLVVTADAAAGLPVVTVSGDYTVLVAETTALKAETVNAVDAGYTWTSSDEKIAVVDDKGVVRGVSPGKVTLTAEGTTTKAKGMIGMLVATTIPNFDKWVKSGHADASAEAFRHWDTPTAEGKVEIPASCAQCHSGWGFSDYIGADGSAADKVDKAAAVGSTVDCAACHSPAAAALSHVVFPSGVKVENLGAEARCMTCHQGRGSTDSVDAKIKTAVDAGAAGPDDVSDKLSFQNIHYYPAGATLNAGRVRGGYQYAGKVYDYRFRHVPGYDTCVGCHDAHSLEVKVEGCKTCHTKMVKLEHARDIRMMSSLSSDYDGDGDLNEGLAGEIDGLKDLLYKTLQTYATDKALDALCYKAAAYPYFFIDADKNGTCDDADKDKYVKWTARMVRAAYNYQLVAKDPGAFAHNGKYVIQLLHDAIADLNEGLKTKVDLSKLVRNDPGHFNGAGEAARHWDADEEVSASCSKCHAGSAGLKFYVKHGVGVAVLEQDNGLDCGTCHAKFTGKWDILPVTSVTFPGGASYAETETKDGKQVAKATVSHLCMTCHSGRTGKADIDAAISQPGFKNVHYLPAGGILLGADARVGYEYKDKTYAGGWAKHTPGTNCDYCHDPIETKHTFRVADAFGKCKTCHSEAKEVHQIKKVHKDDYDGDGTAEDLRDEISGLAAALYAELQKGAGTAKLCYKSTAYPYFFIDTNGDGSCDDKEAVNANKFAAWTAKMMMAAHNYQIYQKEHGAWAHNFDYIAQLLIDSIEDLGGDISKLKRP